MGVYVDGGGRGAAKGVFTWCRTPTLPTLPCSLAADNNDVWTKYTTELYIGAEVFAFLCFAMFIIFFLALVIFQNAVTDHLGMSKCRTRR